VKKSIIEKLFWVPNFFTIAIRKKNGERDSLFYNRFFRSELEMKSSPKHWIADPILAQEGEKTFLFYEACHNGKGLIEVIELLENGKTSLPKIVWEKDYHLSYPFVFKEGDNWYMIPESGAGNQVQLLRAKVFPYEWDCVAVLLEEGYVDTTVQKINGKYILITFKPQTRSEEVVPKAFWMKFNDLKFELKEIEWKEYDSLKVRGAGQFFTENNKIFRPAQISTRDSYGEGIEIKQVEVREESYREQTVFQVFPKDIKFKKYKFDGLHTYTSTERYEAIDVRCSFFDILKPIKKIIKQTNLSK